MKEKHVRGTIRRYSKVKGYGFITMPGDNNVFFNIKDVKDFRKHEHEIEAGLQIQFVVTKGNPGQRAKNIVPIHH